MKELKKKLKKVKSLLKEEREVCVAVAIAVIVLCVLVV